jgi:phospholipase C
MGGVSAHGLGPLGEINHIVVLMLENRSFDHMLGYLKRDGMPDVEGLTGDEKNVDREGNTYPVWELQPDQTAFHKPGKPYDQSLDPCHSVQCVRAQLAGDNGGFVQNFIDMKHPAPEDRRLPMGHYSARHVPAYDFLARQYCVCDAWHASVPGDTWPNRLFSLAGRDGPRVGLERRILELLGKLLPGKAVNAPPIYDVPTFTRLLDPAQWRWYSHDPATLRAADSRYRELFHVDREDFAYFDRKKIAIFTELAEAPIVGDSFLDDAANGVLREVSWIDPNFIDLHIFDSGSNDDHPPSDIKAGQALVMDLYHALVASPQWPETMLVITYDEHGGFYDHVVPPATDDDSGYATFGVRVPALIVGPRVKNFVCKQGFDHTTLIKTILLRFAADPEAAIAQMPRRVQRAQDLAQVLEAAPRQNIADHTDVKAELDEWRRSARAEREGQAAAGVSCAADGAGQPLILNDFQTEFLHFGHAMRHLGLPSGHP